MDFLKEEIHLLKSLLAMFTVFTHRLLLLFVFTINMSLFGLQGIGPKKEKTLIENGYDSLKRLKVANFYDVMRLPGFGYIITCNLWSILGRDLDCISMYEVTECSEEYVMIENKKIVPWRQYKKSKEFVLQPSEYKPQKTTV